MIVKLDLIAHLEIDLDNPELKEGYDMRIAAGETHEEIVAGLTEMLTGCFVELIQDEFNEDGIFTTVEVK